MAARGSVPGGGASVAWGTISVRMPAASPAAAPLWLSSITRHSAGSASSSQAARR